METNFDLLEALIDKLQLRALREELAGCNEVDIAQFLEELTPEKALLAFRTLPKEQASEVFSRLDSEVQQLIISSITDAELSAIVEDLYLDDAVDMLEELPANVVKRVLRSARPETRSLINQFLNYPKDSAGSIMTAEFTDLRGGMTVGEAIAHIRRTGEDRETIYTCYVIDQSRRLNGVVTVKDLLLADDAMVISELMDEDVIAVNTSESQEQAARMMSRYDLLSMPVVDHENRLVGIITVDDAMDVMEEEATKDIESMAAILPPDRPYLKTGVFALFCARIPWLLLLMISATFTGQIIARFEGALAAFTVLTAYIPMLMDTGGNSGSQASVTVIRGLSLGEVEFSDLASVIWKEARVAAACGAVLAAANFIKLMLVDRLLFGNLAVTVPVAAVVCGTLLFTVLCAKLVGCTLPMLAKRLGFDPAVMASPFITTIVDAISLLIYFQFARMVLPL